MRPEDTELLIARYFAGELEPAEAERLLALCRENAEVRAELAALTGAERTLAWLHHDRDARRFEREVMYRLEPDAQASAAFVAGVIARVDRAPDRAAAAVPQPARYVRWPQKLVALAAAIMALALAAWVLDHLISPGRESIAAQSVPQPAHVAVITSMEDVQWGGPALNSVGTALEPGVIELLSGKAGLSFANGAQLVVEGPAKVGLLSESRARLTYGKAAAHVPEGAQGFAVETPSVEIVDLGTEFGVAVERDGVSDVHVFSGKVEARTSGSEAQPGALVALTTAQGRRFDLEGAAEFAPADTNEFPQPPSPSPHAPRTSGAVHFLRQPPVSVETGRLESTEFILLFEERAEVDMDRETMVSIARPGRYSGAHDKLKSRIGPVKRVSSYLVHYDPVERPADLAPLRREGSVTFTTPIVGVILKEGALNQSDAIFGHPGVQYDRDRGRGPERNRRTASGDEIVLSQDKRTLHFNLSVSGDSDQIRVLVRAPEVAESGSKGAQEKGGDFEIVSNQMKLTEFK